MGTSPMQGSRPGGRGPFLCHLQTPSASFWTSMKAYHPDSYITFFCRLLDPVCPSLFLFSFLRKANLIVSLLYPEMISHFPWAKGLSLYFGGYRILSPFAEPPRCMRPSFTTDRNARPPFVFCCAFRLGVSSLRLACREPCSRSGVRPPLATLTYSTLNLAPQSPLEKGRPLRDSLS